MNWKRLEVFIEFLVFGVVVGVIEDLIVVYTTTSEPITWGVIGIVVLIAIPFAFLGEILVDQINFYEIWKWLFKDKNNQV